MPPEIFEILEALRLDFRLVLVEVSYSTFLNVK